MAVLCGLGMLVEVAMVKWALVLIVMDGSWCDRGHVVALKGQRLSGWGDHYRAELPGNQNGPNYRNCVRVLGGGGGGGGGREERHG